MPYKQLLIDNISTKQDFGKSWSKKWLISYSLQILKSKVDFGDNW